MKLPCRHILAFMLKKGGDLFQPTLCHQRWVKFSTSQFAASDMTASSNTQVVKMPSIQRPLSKDAKFRKVNAVLKSITDHVILLPQAQFETCLQEFQKCLNFIADGTIFAGK